MFDRQKKEIVMGLILLIVLLVLVFGGLPNWGYHSYGYRPSGIGGLLLVVVLVLFLSGRL
jgi:uncharacterized membrane protein